MEPHPYPSPDIDGRFAVSLLTDIRELEACRGEWETLLSTSATDLPMLSPLWLLAWWRTFGGRDGRQLMAWTFRKGGRLVGLVPLLRRTHLYFGILPVIRMEMLGSGEETQDEIVSEYLAPIVAKGYELAVAEALARELALGQDRWQELMLSAIDANAPAVLALAPALRGQGWAREVEAPNECPYIELPSRWEDYLSSLHSRNRYYVTRSMRDFLAWAGDNWQVERVSTQADLARGREILLKLHKQRWEKSDKRSLFSSPLFLGFHDEVLPRLLAQNALDLCWLSVRDRPVAVNYSIVWRNRVYFYQGGRDVDVPKEVRPGIVLHLEAIKRYIEEGREEYDFLGGAACYKMKLASTTRQVATWRIVQPSLTGLRYRLLKAGSSFVREVRRRHADGSVSGNGFSTADKADP